MGPEIQSKKRPTENADEAPKEIISLKDVSHHSSINLFTKILIILFFFYQHNNLFLSYHPTDKTMHAIYHTQNEIKINNNNNKMIINDAIKRIHP